MEAEENGDVEKNQENLVLKTYRLKFRIKGF